MQQSYCGHFLELFQSHCGAQYKQIKATKWGAKTAELLSIFPNSLISCFDPLASVPPDISAMWETQHGKLVAVCRAERGKPAANISWSHEGKPVETQAESDGFFTVESRLELPKGTDTKNLTCVISHPYWSEEQTLEPKPRKGQACKMMASF